MGAWESEEPTVDEQLRAQGLRKADSDEAGWYVRVSGRDDEGTFGMTIWATDLPKRRGS